jgi:hypothetical protein
LKPWENPSQKQDIKVEKSEVRKQWESKVGTQQNKIKTMVER